MREVRRCNTAEARGWKLVDEYRNKHSTQKKVSCSMQGPAQARQLQQRCAEIAGALAVPDGCTACPASIGLDEVQGTAAARSEVPKLVLPVGAVRPELEFKHGQHSWPEQDDCQHHCLLLSSYMPSRPVGIETYHM